jgi:pentose-5-phosphate-3-epimerase
MLPRVYASSLSADFGRLWEPAAELEASGAINGLHIDVMDGHSVSNLAMGPQAVEGAADTAADQISETSVREYRY